MTTPKTKTPGEILRKAYMASVKDHCTNERGYTLDPGSNPDLYALVEEDAATAVIRDFVERVKEHAKFLHATASLRIDGDCTWSLHMACEKCQSKAFEELAPK